MRGLLIQDKSIRLKQHKAQLTQLHKEISDLEKQHKLTQKKEVLAILTAKKDNLANILNNHSIRAIQRLNTQYYIHANKPDKFLASKLRERCKASIIPSILLASGASMSHPQHIADTFADFYESLYDDNKVTHSNTLEQQTTTFLKDINLQTLSKENNDTLNAPITSAEVLSVIKDLKMGKAAGPDGFAGEYYRTFKEILVPHLTDFCNFILEGHSIPKDMLQAKIIVIPKPGKNHKICANYRPISLINQDLKILTKILANRLKHILPNLIHPDQVGFVKDREAPDNVRRLLNIIDYNRIWPFNLGLKVENIIPFLGISRPFVGRCCQTCTPKSMESLFYRRYNKLGFHNALFISENDSRYRGWLVRRLCCILFVCERQISRDMASNLPEKICQHPSVQLMIDRDLEEEEVPVKSALRSACTVHMKVLKTLEQMQLSLSPFLIRIVHWLLLKFFGSIFLFIQLHKGQIATVRDASAAQHGIPCVFLATHRSWLDNLLLPFVLFSQNLGVPRVVWDRSSNSSVVQSFLQRLGAVFLPEDIGSQPLSKAVFSAYTEILLAEGQSLLIFLESPSTPYHSLSPTAYEWVQQVITTLQSGMVPDVLIVPVGISYDSTPDTGILRKETYSIRSSLLTLFRIWFYPLGCARVDFAQPFSLQEYLSNYAWRCRDPPPSLQKMLLPYILKGGTRSSLAMEEQEQGDGTNKQHILVDRFILHSLRDAVFCSSVMSSTIISALVLDKHRMGVSFSRLISDFTLLTEEILQRGFDVGFSGKRWNLVRHSLGILRSSVSLFSSPSQNMYVLCKKSQEAICLLRHLSSSLLPIFLYEAVGACAVHALLYQSVLGEVEILFDKDEVIDKLLCLCYLLPRTLLLQLPCQCPYILCQDILDKLIQCGILSMQEDPNAATACDTGRKRFVDTLMWKADDFTDSDSECMGEDIKRYYKVGRSEKHADLLTFYCRLLHPVLWTYKHAAEYLQEPGEWGQDTEQGHVTRLYSYLLQRGEDDGSFECADHYLASCTIKIFMDLGVFEHYPNSHGMMLQISETFLQKENCLKLLRFIQQFIN
ncbi:glycerol-3-phosphate acyltransferase 2, mitochondrial [Bombina bombina]|uniref:glycerol-3-phosphate acyltransferase 2, mitochondrial n=1 Tax=Bombina bombina TaxID=8345 RepID=UPI00235B2236|nr:glycerol-3-phosphate acyltransferase 2, mitochondrial [Bombina bombina]